MTAGMEDPLLKLATTFLLGGFVSLLTMTNPLSKIPMYLSLTSEMSSIAARDEARRSCLYSFGIMVSALFAGVAILHTFGISYGALRIAGGITVALLGHRMLFATADAVIAHPARQSIAFFPLALPGIAGPGTIATVIGVSTEIAELTSGPMRAIAYGATVLSVALSCLVMWLTLRSARWVSRWLGDEGINVITRLTGFLLVCIGVQFVGSGVRTFMAGA